MNITSHYISNITLNKYTLHLSLHKYNIPREKVEFSLLMHEINVLTYWTILALDYALKKDEYPDLNRERTVPHTVVLPIELYSP